MRQALHKLVGVAFWALLVGMWFMLVTGDRVGIPQIVDSIQYVAVVAGAVLALTIAWVRHNVGIHRRKGARAASPPAPPRTDEDRLGRPLRWALAGEHEAALAENHLVVELEDGVKVYRSA